MRPDIMGLLSCGNCEYVIGDVRVFLKHLSGTHGIVIGKQISVEAFGDPPSLSDSLSSSSSASSSSSSSPSQEWSRAHSPYVQPPHRPQHSRPSLKTSGTSLNTGNSASSTQKSAPLRDLIVTSPPRRPNAPYTYHDANIHSIPAPASHPLTNTNTTTIQSPSSRLLTKPTISVMNSLLFKSPCRILWNLHNTLICIECSNSISVDEIACHWHSCELTSKEKAPLVKMIGYVQV
ncbi:hypothetical protein BJ165DRAFT_1528968 [Panaeolus papilionaceus]|nr:hypothetical protein BJ165DRAFT_1528968 [Panaeolus papilionaceus]